MKWMRKWLSELIRLCILSFLFRTGEIDCGNVWKSTLPMQQQLHVINETPLPLSFPHNDTITVTLRNDSISVEEAGASDVSLRLGDWVADVWRGLAERLFSSWSDYFGSGDQPQTKSSAEEDGRPVDDSPMPVVIARNSTPDDEATLTAAPQHIQLPQLPRRTWLGYTQEIVRSASALWLNATTQSYAAVRRIWYRDQRQSNAADTNSDVPRIIVTFIILLVLVKYYNRYLLLYSQLVGWRMWFVCCCCCSSSGRQHHQVLHDVPVPVLTTNYLPAAR